MDLSEAYAHAKRKYRAVLNSSTFEEESADLSELREELQALAPYRQEVNRNLLCWEEV